MRCTARLWSCLALAVTCGALAACGNPATDVLVEALGPEVEGVPAGDFHRPGQPCLLCHSKYGGDSEMSIAGTIYSIPTMVADPDNPDALVLPPTVDKAEIILVDSNGNSPPTVPMTNCIGNFWIYKDQWDPAFPVYAEIRFPIPPGDSGEMGRAVMGSWIQREGSCNACHQGDRTQGSAGRIYCRAEMPTPPFEFPVNCQGLP